MPATDYALRARSEKAERAAEIGIDDRLISELVESFYARVRGNPMLGPIFERHVADWTPHLARMKDFWASIALESGRFHGNPMAKHVAIGNLDHAHFDEWLGLFRDTLEEVVPNPQARAFFAERARRIAESLLMGIRLQRDGLQGLNTKPQGD